MYQMSPFIAVYRFVSGFDLLTLQKSYACSITVNISRDCILFGDLSCEFMEEHIVIKNALFGFRQTEYKDCNVDEVTCRLSQDSGCCTKTKGDKMQPLSQGQLNNVATKCSFNSKCTDLQADIGQLGHGSGERSLFSVIYSVCQPGT